MRRTPAELAGVPPARRSASTPSTRGRWPPGGATSSASPVVDDRSHDWHTLEHATPDPVLTLDFAPVARERSQPRALGRQRRRTWLLAAGATALGQPDWTVLADPRATSSACSRTQDVGRRPRRPASREPDLDVPSSTATGDGPRRTSSSAAPDRRAPRQLPRPARSVALRTTARGHDLSVGPHRSPRPPPPHDGRVSQSPWREPEPCPARRRAPGGVRSVAHAGGPRQHSSDAGAVVIIRTWHVLAPSGQPPVERVDTSTRRTPVAEPRQSAPQGAHADQPPS